MAVTTTLKTLRESIADQLGLLINTSLDTGGVLSTTYTINALADKTPDAERMRDSYLYQSGVFRRIISFGYPATNDVTLARSVNFAASAAQIYFMLDPDELNGAINEGLKELWFDDAVTVTLVANTYIYTLAGALQKKSQVTSVKWRDISILTTRPKEEEVESYRLIEKANALQLFINWQLRDVTTFDVQVYYRPNYQSLASDAATTTCPYPLIFAVGMVKVLQKLFTKYGKGIASLYGPKIQIAEGEMAKAKMDWLPKLTSREYVEEEIWEGIDSNTYFDYPTW